MSTDTIITVLGPGVNIHFTGAENSTANGTTLRFATQKDWQQWLAANFTASFSANSQQWQHLLSAVGEPLRARLDPQACFSVLSQKLHQQKLYAFQTALSPSKAKSADDGEDAAAQQQPRTNDGDAAAKPASSQSKNTNPTNTAAATAAQDEQKVATTPPEASQAQQQPVGDPVVPATGEEVLPLDDLTINNALPLTWQRLYRSRRSDIDIGLGYGWFCPLLRRLWRDEECIWVEDEQARLLRFPWLEPGEHAWQTATGQRLDYRHDGQLQLTDADGTIWTYRVNEQGTGQLKRRLTLTGQQWLFDYDEHSRLSQLTLNAHQQLHFTYQQQRIQRIALHSGQQQYPLVHYHYDERGDLISAQTPQGIEQYQYRHHLLIERTRPSGYRFLMTWQGDGPQARCIRTQGEDGSYDAQLDYQSDYTDVTHGDGRQQRFYFDEQGRVTQLQESDGTKQFWHYDNKGRLREHVLADGRRYRYDFDRFGRPVADWLPDERCHRRFFNELGFCIAESLPDGRYLSRKIDALGRLLEQRDPDGTQWRYDYDEHGWPQTITNQHGLTIHQGYDENGRLLASEGPYGLTRYAYDQYGQLRGTLVEDRVIEREYQHGKLTAEHDYPQNAPQQRATKQYRYDQAGRLTYYKTPTGAEHQFDYAGLDRPLRYHRPDGKTIHYSYDKSERLTEVVRADGGRWQLSYNPHSRVSRVQTPDGRDVHFRYDGAGAIVHREQPGLWVQHLKRDKGGRVTRQVSQGKGRQPVTKHFQYDSHGRRVLATAEGRRLRWQYDERGLVSAHYQDNHALHYHYLDGGLLHTLQLPDGRTLRYEYDQAGRWQQIWLDNDKLMERQFGSQGKEQFREAGANKQQQVWDRKQLLVNRQWQGKQAVTRRYTWNDDNHLESAADTELGERTFKRDSVGQLIGENTQHYHYDEAGNRLSDPTQRCQRDRLHHHRYDELGAEIGVHLPSEQAQQRYFDAEGCLVAIDVDGTQLRYGYDALGRRAWRKSPEGQTDYLWHEEVLLGQYQQDHWQFFIRDPQTNEPLCTLIDGVPYFYELDWRQMPVRLWSSQGDVVWQGDSDAWGNVNVTTADVNQPLRLPGQFVDDLTGLYFNRFRDYDPTTGRYLTPDPLGLNGGFNGYSYTPNPVDYIDPLGLCPNLARQRGGPERIDPSQPPDLSELQFANTKAQNDQLKYDHVLAGHGTVGPEKRIVPAGCSITVYAVEGALITDNLGVAIEQAKANGTPIPDHVYRKTYYEGEQMPQLWLHARDFDDEDVSEPLPSSIALQEGSGMKKEILKIMQDNGEGDYHLAACLWPERELGTTKNDNVRHDTSGIYHVRIKQDMKHREIRKLENKTWKKFD